VEYIVTEPNAQLDGFHLRQLKKDKSMKKTLSTLVLCVALASGSALAADLPSRKAAPASEPRLRSFHGQVSMSARMLAAAWGASYRGGSQGYVLGGGQIGYNLQLSPLFVAGLETDFQGASSHNLDWFGTVRAASASPPSARTY